MTGAKLEEAEDPSEKMEEMPDGPICCASPPLTLIEDSAADVPVVANRVVVPLLLAAVVVAERFNVFFCIQRSWCNYRSEWKNSAIPFFIH